MNKKKDITIKMFKWWWNISDLNVEEIIESYVTLLNFIKNNSAEDGKKYADNITDRIISYEETWNTTGKEW